VRRLAPPPTEIPNDQHVVLRVVAKLLIPLIVPCSHSTCSSTAISAPGGGFQAGVIMAVAIILHALGVRAACDDGGGARRASRGQPGGAGRGRSMRACRR
jgi:hypothetical protein